MLIKRLLLPLFAVGLFGLSTPGNAAVASVDYVHATILELKDVTVPVQMVGGGTNYSIPVSLKYFMRQIDKANEVLNGTATTNYAGALTTAQETNLVEVNRARADIEALIEGPSAPSYPSFSVYLSGISANDSFNFQMSAVGDFNIDWGDGSTIETVTRTNTTNTVYSYTYPSAGNYTVTIYGLVTGYTTDSYTAAISFGYQTGYDKITGISNTLSDIFPTLGNINGQQPRFYNTFGGCRYITGSIPSGLFSNISGTPATFMFCQTFSNCSGLTTIPSNLFSGIISAPVEYLFYQTFSGCTEVTAIPSGLFSSISGAPELCMFAYTFSNCRTVSAIPSGLFSGIFGAPAQAMYNGTFSGCINITSSIPHGLLGTISGAAAKSMFESTFGSCSKLSGSIPSGLFGTITGMLVEGMFRNTFNGCVSLTGIEDGIWDLTGMLNQSEVPINMVNEIYRTFYNCSGITSAPPTIAAGNPTMLWEKFTIKRQSPFYGAVNMQGYNDIPVDWKST